MSITSANTIFMMGIADLFPAPQQIQGYSADDVSSYDAMEVAETAMGVDGTLTGGFVNVPISQNITLMADSPSNTIFDTWWASQNQIKDLYLATGTITYPSLGVKYTLTNGILRTYPAIADAQRTLRPRRFTVVWQLSPAQPA